MTLKTSVNKTRLPDNFLPSRGTVVCGRGKLCVQSPGNTYLKSIVQEYLKPYSHAKTKIDKSAIVSVVLSTVKQTAHPEPAFVKLDENKMYWEVDDAFAREKIGCMFRDMLHTQYRSSNKAKNARKKVTQNKTINSLHKHIIIASESNKVVTELFDESWEEYLKDFVHHIPMGDKPDFFKSCLPPLVFSLQKSPSPSFPPPGFFKNSCRPLSSRIPRQVSVEESVADAATCFLNDDELSVIDDLDLPEDISDLFC